MDIAILSLIVISIGTLFTIIGGGISLYKLSQDIKKEKGDGVETQPAGVGEALGALAKLAEALKQHTVGMQFILVGIAMIIIGGFLAGIHCLN